ncbi:TRAP transporter small permease [Polymorphum gilvum]|uniref:TRAP transporter small permease protein n=1 Tax=Polymorphum gilvum (strain LMG 25793 / CGMCC 1.9160 / SL003B-26A1) TaxID=991905 RepID=F2J6B4_POLGS|nr:TRAP transporter small permease [Polymorphum gilvum]ADZ71287.1 TRAP transporter, DctQ-like membrane protein [Polymorphum gilvum SL003B-26A1]
MRSLFRVQDGLLLLLALIGALAIITLMLHVVADVALRNAVNSPIPATYEIVTHYYMIALAFIPLAWVERGGGMVQVEVIEPLLGPRALEWSDRMVALVSTVIYGALAWVTWQTALKNYDTGVFVLAQNTRVPTWPAYFLVPLGFGLAALVTAIRMIVPKQESAK